MCARPHASPSEPLSEKPVEVVLDGEVTIVRAAEVRDQLLAAFEAGRPVHLDLTGLEACDLTLLQMICACHRLAGKLRRGFRVRGGRNEILLQAISDAGMARKTSCVSGDPDGCICIQLVGEE